MYAPILLFAMFVGYLAIGYILRQFLSKNILVYVPQFINWIGIPILVVTSVKFSSLVNELWIVPVIAVVTVVVGVIFSAIAIDLSENNERTDKLLHSAKIINEFTIDHYSKNTSSLSNKIKNNDFRFNFLIEATLGNTHSIAFPLILLSLSSYQISYFTWAVIFDLCSNLVGLYFIYIANHVIHKKNLTSQIYLEPIKNLFASKIFWSLVIGLFLSTIPLSSPLENIVNQSRNLIIPMCLIASGMQINPPKTIVKKNPIIKCLIIKMLIIPLVMAALLLALPIKDLPIFVLLLQISMPPLLMDDLICKEYNLSQDFNFALNSIGCAVLGLTVPILFILFNVSSG